MRTGTTLAAVALLTALSIGRASAEVPVSEADHAAAVAEFGAGRALFDANDCKNAIPHFVASLKKEQSVGARFNLADCSAREGKNAAAWNHYKAAEQLAIRKSDTQRVDLAHAAAAGLDQKVTKVRLVLPSGPQLKLAIDDAEVEETDHWLLSTGYALEPRAPHTITVTVPGRPRWSREGVKGDPGVELPAMVVDFGSPQPAPEKTPPLRTASYVTGGIGIAALAAGGVFALLASSSKSTAQRECTEGGANFSYPGNCNPARQADVDPANERAQSQATVATAAVIGGAVLLSAAGIMFYVSRSKSTTVGLAGSGCVLSGAF